MFCMFWYVILKQGQANISSLKTTFMVLTSSFCFKFLGSAGLLIVSFFSEGFEACWKCFVANYCQNIC